MFLLNHIKIAISHLKHVAIFMYFMVYVITNWSTRLRWVRGQLLDQSWL